MAVEVNAADTVTLINLGSQNLQDCISNGCVSTISYFSSEIYVTKG